MSLGKLVGRRVLIILDGPGLEKQQMMLREKTQQHLDAYTKRGLRTLCVAKRVRLLRVPVGWLPSFLAPLSFNENERISNPDLSIGKSFWATGLYFHIASLFLIYWLVVVCSQSILPERCLKVILSEFSHVSIYPSAFVWKLQYDWK